MFYGWCDGRHQPFLFYGVEGDGGFDYGQGADAGERDVLWLEMGVLADKSDEARIIWFLDVLDYGECISAGIEGEEIDLAPQDTIEG